MEHTILKRMVGYWHTHDLPQDIRKIRMSWEKFGPDSIVIYDREAALAFIGKHYGDREVAAFEACAIPAMQSDLFRVLEILRNGGFYLDLGIELLGHPMEFLSPGEDLVLYRRWHGRIVNNMFAAAPGNPILREICERILVNIEERVSNNVWKVTGPLVWNTVTETGSLQTGIRVIEHADIAGKSVQFHQDLNHKKEGRHWHDQQSNRSIFTS